MSLIGIRNFLLLVRIDSLTEFFKNHYVIVNPISNKILKITSMLSIDARSDSYNYNILGHNNKIIRVNKNYSPSPNQIVILINNSLPRTKMVDDYIISYLSSPSLIKFVENSSRDIDINKITINPIDNI